MTNLHDIIEEEVQKALGEAPTEVFDRAIYDGKRERLTASLTRLAHTMAEEVRGEKKNEKDINVDEIKWQYYVTGWNGAITAQDEKIARFMGDSAIIK